MAELSKIRKNGVDYDIKDAVARKAIEEFGQNGVTGTKVYVTIADDGTIVIAPDVGDGLANGVTITAILADDGTIVIGGV